MDTGRSGHDRAGWLEASGLPHILRALGLAIHPAKIGLAFAALLLTFVLGIVLDWAWTRGEGVHENAVATYITARQLDQPYVEPAGPHGPFRVFREHQRRAISGFLGSSLPIAASTGADGYVATPLGNLMAMGYGVLWMVRHHPFYFLLFGLGALIVWAWAGGAICRIAAVHFAKDEKPTMKQGLDYARGKLFGGFVLAPCIPLAFAFIAAVIMVLGGLLLRIPVFGDLVAGSLFSLAIFGGFVIAILLVGLVVGGSLFWPAVATEGSDAFDSFSRSLSYPLSRPWKAALYAILAVVYTSLCWLLANLFVYLALSVTRAVVGFGTAPFGRLMREVGGTPIRKLDLVWPLGGSSGLWTAPTWANLTWYEYISAALIGMDVLIVIGLLWAFLFSFYFCASTVVYFLLRRDVDGTDLNEVQVDDEPLPQTPAAPATPLSINP